MPNTEEKSAQQNKDVCYPFLNFLLVLNPQSSLIQYRKYEIYTFLIVVEQHQGMLCYRLRVNGDEIRTREEKRAKLLHLIHFDQLNLKIVLSKHFIK